jgi:hypothetical protein
MTPIDGAVSDIVQGGINAEALITLLIAVIIIIVSMVIYRFARSLVIYREFKASDYFAKGTTFAVDGNSAVSEWIIDDIRRTHAFCRNVNGRAVRRVPLADFLNQPVSIVTHRASQKPVEQRDDEAEPDDDGEACGCET